ncbi:hypothetical protein [Aquitalea aquatilis]|uniref:hypothetical protein n=1 Tax=Aquitalea aquatilis TaxID=1537400 RepID=UPI0010BCF2C7|nr:hypothetical protein [Aquitalea aquatilis]
MTRPTLAHIGKTIREARTSDLYAKVPAALPASVIRQEQATRRRKHDSDDRRELAQLNREYWQ